MKKGVSDPQLDEFLAEINDRVRRDPFLNKYRFGLFINNNPMYKEHAKNNYVKPMGAMNITTTMLNETCPKCGGCKLKTDKVFVWCSGVFCSHIHSYTESTESVEETEDWEEETF